jgi:uncharacterized cupin superfamily protein
MSDGERRNVVNETDLDWTRESAPDGSALRLRKKLAAAAGGQEIGASLYRMPPGEKAWPRHFHVANEEALYVLAGEGTLALGDATVALRAGDWVSIPAGEARAHQIRNESGADLVFLCVSTMRHPDVIVYPDSGKIGVFAGAAPGGPPQELTLRKFLSLAGEVDYWKDE